MSERKPLDARAWSLAIVIESAYKQGALAERGRIRRFVEDLGQTRGNGSYARGQQYIINRILEALR